MSIEVIMPQMGESIAEGTLVRWLKKVGESVNRDEPLFEISTDKVDTEIPSPADGILQEIRVEEGQTVPVQTVVGLLATDQPAPATAEPAPAAAAPPPRPAAPVADSAPVVAAATATRAPVLESPALNREERLRQRSSPLVRRIAREHGIDLRDITGTGTSGRVTKKDILGFIEQRGIEATPTVPSVTRTATPPAAGARVEPLSKMRQQIAEHMVLSKRTSPHVTTVFEIDMTDVDRTIREKKEAFQKANGVKLTYLPFIMQATISGLREFPIVNATLSGNNVHYHENIHLGIAVALDDGLIVPVVKNAEEKNLIGLTRAVRDLAGRARSRQLQPEEVQGGTFTITNHGVFGSLFATPVINQPQAGILGVGAVTRRPVVLPDTEAIAIRSMMYLGLSFDHRLIDGATADRFVAHIKEILEGYQFPSLDT